MSAEVARILRKAADLLEREGWCRGWGRADGIGPACAAHAIERVASPVANGISLANDAVRTVRHHLGLEVENDWPGFLELGFWNDRQSSPEPVIAALRAAADQAEQA